VPKLDSQFALERCPHCQVDKPLLLELARLETNDQGNRNPRIWKVYACRSCGGMVAAWAPNRGTADVEASEWFPKGATVDEDLPERAKSYLKQALASLHAPAGCVMLCASAVDAMLKAKGLVEGSLYSRIDKAAADHAITTTWPSGLTKSASTRMTSDTWTMAPTCPMPPTPAVVWSSSPH
jgi:hypothetical protein